MQNQSYTLKNRHFSPIQLPTDFPVFTIGLINQKCKHITGLHAHDCLEIGYCHKGSGVFIVEDKILPFTKGDVSFIVNNEMHFSRSSIGLEETHWTFIFLKTAELLEAHGDMQYIKSDHLKGAAFCNIISASTFPEISTIVRDLVEEIGAQKPGREQLIRNLVSTLLIKINRMYPTLADEKSTSKKLSRQRIIPAIEMILHNAAEPVYIDKLAAKCHLSTPHFRRIFCQAMGMSPKKYIIIFRIKLAQKMLVTTTKSILEISLNVGYNTLSSFNRHFKHIVGKSPRDWRDSYTDK